LNLLTPQQPYIHKAMKINKLLSIMLLPLFLMAGCGGSSSTDSAPTTPVTPITPPVPPVPPVPTVNKIKVVPALGAFGAGANVAFIRPDGSQIAAAQTNASGSAELDMGSYTGPFFS
jgi:ABC-type glycerol-3-phosphate transport system substrate-binding protein